MSFRRGLSLSPSACGALKNMLVRQQQKNICRPRIEYCGPVAAGYQPISTVRRWKTNDASSKHAEFQKQMLELEEEQIQLFGRGGEDVGGTVSELERLGASSAGDEKFQEQVSEVNEEQTKLFGTGDVDGGGEGDVSEMERLGNDRQHLFEFTSEDMDAWRGRNIPKNADTPTARPADPPAPSAFTHLAEERGAPVARMVDVSSKSPGAKRSATARATVRFPPEIVTELGLPSDGGEAHGPKGPIFATARLAGIMAAKRTSELIPLCHPLSLSCVEVDVRMEGSSSAVIECTATLAGGRTGVEMEALTGASVAALTVYDMCKAVSHRIEWSVELLRKEGGKRGTIDLEEENQ